MPTQLRERCSLCSKLGQHRLTNMICSHKTWRRLQDDLISRSTGGPLSEALNEEVAAIQDAGLDEAAGEGYHRSTYHEHCRAPSASTVHLKRATRSKQVLKTVRRLILTHRELGKDVLRYEWTHWRRILQVFHKRRWRSKRMKRREFISCVYREDAKAAEDWTSIMHRLPDHRAAVPAKSSEAERLETEWINASIEVNGIYSVEHEVERAAENGGEEKVNKQEFFR